jgi:hypothetical protein
MLAFVIAGFIFMGMHDLLIGTIDYTGNRALQQTSKKHH